jgi:hypothetical protein
LPLTNRFLAFSRAGAKAENPGPVVPTLANRVKKRGDIVQHASRNSSLFVNESSLDLTQRLSAAKPQPKETTDFMDHTDS